jgi:hypothetical protein
MARVKGVKMNVNEQHAEQEEFRLVAVLPWSQMLLAEYQGHTRRLPRVKIFKWSRTAQQLSATLHKKWGLRSIIIDLLPSSDDLPRCAVVEVRSHDETLAHIGCVTLSVDDLAEHELSSTERLVVKSIIAGETQDRGPFSKIGWIEEAQAWIRESVGDRRIDFSEDIRQLGASGSSALVRFGTFDGQAYWLKATATPNEHEFAVTQAVARHCPQFLPPLVAVRADWNAWVSEEAGQTLHECSSWQAFEQATRCLAEMQIASTLHIDDLIARGCFDQRMPMLQSHLPALIYYLEAAMARQTSTRVPSLSSARLRELGQLLHWAAGAMEAVGIPDALIHNDVNPGNILFDGIRAVFTDWSETGIGAPFLTFQHLQVQAWEADETHTWAPRLKEIYVRHWQNILTGSQIEKAFALIPPLAIASYLCGRDPSFASSHRGNDSVQSYARSLARHLDRFAQVPQFREALCN